MLSNLLSRHRRTHLQKEHPWSSLLEAQSDELKTLRRFFTPITIFHFTPTKLTKLTLKLDLGFQGLDVHEQNALKKLSGGTWKFFMGG